MKKAATLILAATAQAEEQGGGYAAAIYSQGSRYSNSPYVEKKPTGYGHTQDYIEPVVPELSPPYPFTKFLIDEKEKLNIPALGGYHCFLTGAPWTSCGRRSLTSYFLDQCMEFHEAMSKNVDGICGGQPPKAAPKPDEMNELYYGYAAKFSGKATSGAAAATAAKTTTSDSYLSEKCYQNVYKEITTATVMCLTENMIRMKYIEHYSSIAATNPIEGPILYLRKLHEFMDEVITSCQNSPYNFPNLWVDAAGFNPNAPYYTGDNGKVKVHEYQSGEASGLAHYRVGNQFLCGNVNFLAGNDYIAVPMEKHYRIGLLENCKVKAKDLFGVEEETYHCRARITTGSDEDTFDSVRGVGEQYLVDMTLPYLYNAVHYIDVENSALRRPMSVAEVAISNAGLHEQPMLEGFGILYFCAFHACKANNGGNVDGSCYPSVTDDDWNYDALDAEWLKLKNASDKINTCLDSKIHLTTFDIVKDNAVKDFRTALQRSYICMAEDEVASFFLDLFPKVQPASALVYGRHLAIEKCYESEQGLCVSDEKLYQLLQKALDSLVDTCKASEKDLKARLKKKASMEAKTKA